MRIERIGEVNVWWIERPLGPRVSPRVGATALGLTLPLLIAALLWVGWRGERLWPWTTVVPTTPSTPQYLLRYLLLISSGACYLVLRSVPAWWRLARLARADLQGAAEAVARADWPRTALHLHRHAVLSSELGRSPDAAALDLDRQTRSHLGTARRLYIYSRPPPPPLPESPTAGFHPRVVPLTLAGGWWTGFIVAVLGAGTVAELYDAYLARSWHPLLNVSFLIALGLLLVYGYVYVAGLLGRRSYFRFTPGTAELVRFKVRRAKTRVETIPLRRCDVFLDLTRPTITVAFLDRGARARLAEYHLVRSPANLETCLRAVLSQAAMHELPEGELLGG